MPGAFGERIDSSGRDAVTGDPAAEEGDRLVSGAGRRQLTVLFCDLVGSTELASRLDPEDLREVVLEYQALCAKVIGRYDGHVAQYLGDGLLVYFGYPIAHEDDAQRAVRTGLGIVDAIGRAEARFGRQWGVRPQVRVGIHTGVVVAGEVGAGPTREDLALGQAPNVAARLQGLADPDGVLLSGATEHLVTGYFELDALGPQELKGVAGTVDVYRALRESAARSRLEANAAHGLPTLVGRDTEAALLRDAWGRVEDGSGQVLLITGDAGLGKSRLVRMLEEHVAGRPGGWLTPCQCSPYHQATALYPFIDLLERVVLRFGRDDSADDRSDRLEGWLVQNGFDLAATRPLFADLLGLPPSGAYPPLGDTPERQKQATIEALVDALLVRAAERPTLFVIEDVHWADPTTGELLGSMLHRVAGNRLMVVITYRPGGRPPGLDPTLPELEVGRLEPGAGAALVDDVAGAETLPDEVRRQIVDRTDGVPLFIEELTRNILESGVLDGASAAGRSSALPASAIPATLQDLLMARLDRLGDRKPLAQLAAVIGREFGFDLLAAVAGGGAASLHERLAQLLAADVLQARGDPGDERFGFRHALIQETAYGSLLRGDRLGLHARVARALLAGAGDPSEARPETIAYHLSQAGMPAEAVPHWVAAGMAAMARSANLEAISHLGSALDQLELLPDGPERAGHELGLRVLIAVPMTLTRGWANPEVGASYARASSLIGPAGDAPQLFPTRVGILTYHLVRGEMAVAYEMAAQELDLAERFGQPELRLEAEVDRGTTSYYLGHTARALEHLERAIAIYDPALHHAHAFMYGKDPGAVALVHASGALWLLGRAEDGLAAAKRARALAGTWAHPFSAIWAAIGEAFALQVRGDAAGLREVSEWVVAESMAQVFPNWLAQGQVFLGWALAASGEVGPGIGMIRQGLGLWDMTGAELFKTYLAYLLADALRMAGDPEALAVIEGAFAQADRSEERFWEAELHRFHGELLRAAGDTEGAAADFDRALAGARARGQLGLELRAATSRARLLGETGRPAEASSVLGPVLARVTQGAGTADVVVARELLASLAITTGG